MEFNFGDILNSKNFHAVVFGIAVACGLAWLSPQSPIAMLVFIFAVAILLYKLSIYIFQTFSERHRQIIATEELARRNKEKSDLANAKINAKVERIYHSMTDEQKKLVAHLVLSGKPDKSELATFFYSKVLIHQDKLWRLIVVCENATSFHQDGYFDFQSSLVHHVDEYNHVVVHFDPYFLELIQQYIKGNNITIYEQQD